MLDILESKPQKAIFTWIEHLLPNTGSLHKTRINNTKRHLKGLNVLPKSGKVTY